MKLYYLPGACSLATHIVACELQLDVDLIPVDRTESGKTAGGQNYLSINPKGAVPTVELESGARLTENAVILQYLAAKYPEAALMPQEGMEKWRALEILNFLATELHKGFAVLFNRALPAEASPAFIAAFNDRLTLAEQMLGEQPYLLGEDFSILDAYLFTVLGWPKYLNMDISAWPKLVAFSKRVGARPAVQQALREEGLLG